MQALQVLVDKNKVSLTADAGLWVYSQHMCYSMRCLTYLAAGVLLEGFVPQIVTILK